MSCVVKGNLTVTNKEQHVSKLVEFVAISKNVFNFFNERTAAFYFE